MESLLIQSTEDTPQVNFNASTGILEISGRSLPEDASGFYAPVMDWLKAYKTSPNSTSILVMKLEYFNTASSKIILDVFTTIEKISNDRKVIWHYDKDDEDMLEAGQEFSEIVEVPFEYKSY
jgi:hypothetical protein